MARLSKQGNGRGGIPRQRNTTTFDCINGCDLSQKASKSSLDQTVSLNRSDRRRYLKEMAAIC